MTQVLVEDSGARDYLISLGEAKVILDRISVSTNMYYPKHEARDIYAEMLQKGMVHLEGFATLTIQK